MAKRKKHSEQDTVSSKRRECGEWKELDRENRGNEQYLEYYKLQHIINDNDQEEFLKVLVFVFRLQ